MDFTIEQLGFIWNDKEQRYDHDATDGFISKEDFTGLPKSEWAKVLINLVAVRASTAVLVEAKATYEQEISDVKKFAEQARNSGLRVKQWKK